MLNNYRNGCPRLHVFFCNVQGWRRCYLGVCVCVCTICTVINWLKHSIMLSKSLCNKPPWNVLNSVITKLYSRSVVRPMHEWCCVHCTQCGTIFLPVFFFSSTAHCIAPGGGGFSHWHGIRICACLLGHFFMTFSIAIGGFSSETKEPKLHKLGVFWANYCKKHPIWSKLGAFLSKMVYWWVGNLAKNWYRDSQIFEVRQAHPRTILVKEPPLGIACYTSTMLD